MAAFYGSIFWVHLMEGCWRFVVGKCYGRVLWKDVRVLVSGVCYGSVLPEHVMEVLWACVMGACNQTVLWKGVGDVCDRSMLPNSVMEGCCRRVWQVCVTGVC